TFRPTSFLFGTMVEARMDLARWEVREHPSQQVSRFQIEPGLEIKGSARTARFRLIPATQSESTSLTPKWFRMCPPCACDSLLTAAWDLALPFSAPEPRLAFPPLLWRETRRWDFSTPQRSA